MSLPAPAWRLLSRPRYKQNMPAPAVKRQHGPVDLQDLALQVGDGHAVGDGVDMAALADRRFSLFAHAGILSKTKANFNRWGGIENGNGPETENLRPGRAASSQEEIE